MPDDEILIESKTVVEGQAPLSPTPARANALRLTLEAGDGTAAKPALVLHGYFNLDTTIAGRYSSSLPAPIRVVAVARSTGHIYMSTLARQDDIPPVYRGASAQPSITGPNGPVPRGISQSGYFSVDMKAHLGLADKAETYDVFLWLEDVVSDVVSMDKPAEQGDRPGNRMSYRPPSIATVRSAPRSELLELSAEGVGDERTILGRVGQPAVSIAAYCVNTGQQAWTRLEAEAEAGMEFSIRMADLLPGSKRDDRILIFAISGGKRSALLDSASH